MSGEPAARRGRRASRSRAGSRASTRRARSRATSCASTPSACRTVELNTTFYRLPDGRAARALGGDGARRLPLRGQGAAVDLTVCGRRRRGAASSARARARSATASARCSCASHDTRDARRRVPGRAARRRSTPTLAVALDLRDPSWDGIEPELERWGAVRVNQLEAARAVPLPAAARAALRRRRAARAGRERIRRAARRRR